MLIVCAGCKKDMGEKAPLIDTSISHSICAPCGKRLYGEIWTKAMARKGEGNGEDEGDGEGN